MIDFVRMHAKAKKLLFDSLAQWLRRTKEETKIDHTLPFVLFIFHKRTTEDRFLTMEKNYEEAKKYKEATKNEWV